MANERLVRNIHLPLFVLLFIITVIEMSIAASLVSHGNSYGYGDVSIRDRDRVLLTAGIWSTVIAIYYSVGVFFAAGNIAFGIMAHLVGLSIGFILMLSGVSALTAHIRHRDCGNPDETFPRCNVTKGLEAMGWIATVWLFICLVFVFVLGVKSRSSTGMRRGNLLTA